MPQIDRLFEHHQVGLGEFAFDEKVAAVFDDMILRSVPLYRDLQAMIPRLVNTLTADPVRVVDLGCSTGASLIQLATDTELAARKLDLIGVDNSRAMLKRCRDRLKEFDISFPVELVEADLQKLEWGAVDAVLMNYTLQFVPPDQRLSVLQGIRDSIRPGGWLLLSEKFCHADPQIDQAWKEIYVAYKRGNGYSELEIARKRDALENVLVPLTPEANMQLLRQAGFASSEMLLKWFNFGTILAKV